MYRGAKKKKHGAMRIEGWNWEGGEQVDVVERMWDGQMDVVERMWVGQVDVVERMWDGQVDVVERMWVGQGGITSCICVFSFPSHCFKACSNVLPSLK